MLKQFATTELDLPKWEICFVQIKLILIIPSEGMKQKEIENPKICSSWPSDDERRRSYDPVNKLQKLKSIENIENKIDENKNEESRELQTNFFNILSTKSKTFKFQLLSDENEQNFRDLSMEKL